MAKTWRERQDDEREERLEHMREQITSGDLTVRQMTREERARWKEHSAESARHLPPEERARRKAAVTKQARSREMRNTSPGGS